MFWCCNLNMRNAVRQEKGMKKTMHCRASGVYLFKSCATSKVFRSHYSNTVKPFIYFFYEIQKEREVQTSAKFWLKIFHEWILLSKRAYYPIRAFVQYIFFYSISFSELVSLFQSIPRISSSWKRIGFVLQSLNEYHLAFCRNVCVFFF